MPQASPQKRERARKTQSANSCTSVPLSKYPSEQQIREFYRLIPTKLNTYSIETILGWYREDVAYQESARLPQHGVKMIKDESGIEIFDVAVIDGSEFTGQPDLEETYGSKIVVLDDINSFKNHATCLRLLQDAAYRLTAGNVKLRSGYAVFERI